LAEKKKYYIFELAKFLACLMIINSHCRGLYPLQYLAIGGAFGNGIFFILSGYFNCNIKNNFNDWIKKKINRLLPSVLVIIFAEELINFIAYNKFIGLLDVINQYWFIFALFIYLIIFYPLFKRKNEKSIIFFIILFASVYIIAYIINFKNNFFIELEGFTFLKVIEYGIIYLCGAFIFTKEEEILSFMKGKNISNVHLIICILLNIFIWVVVYFLVFVKEIFFKEQILIALSVILFSFFVLILCINNKELEFKFARKLINLISASTLEIYIVQVTYQKFILYNKFPIALISFWIFSLFIGCIYYIAINKITLKYRL
jgi:hypothetical protein